MHFCWFCAGSLLCFYWSNRLIFVVLMKCFNGFCKDGVVHADTVGEILQMMGLRVKKEALQAIIDEVDEDGKENIYI